MSQDLRTFVSYCLTQIASEIEEIKNEQKTHHEVHHNIQHRLIPFIKEAGASKQLSIIACREPSEHMSVAQFKVLKQEKNGSCGYYALYNIITTVCALHTPLQHSGDGHKDTEDVLKHLEMINSRTRFWITYKALLNKLHAKAAKEGITAYPWGKKHIDGGVLERPHMDYLVGEHQLSDLCGGLDFELVILPDFSLTHLKNNMLPIQRLQHLHEVFSAIKSSSNVVVAFMIGSVCHWISIVCNKVNDHLEILLFDSRNHNLFDSTEEEFEKIISDSEKEDKEPINPFMRDAYLLSLKEPKLMINLFHDCIVGGSNILSLLLDMNLEAFLESFDKHVTSKDDATKGEVSVPNLVHWLECYWPPPVIRSNVINMLAQLGVRQNKQLVSAHVQKRLSSWVDLLLKSVDFQSSGIPIIEKIGRAHV